MKQQRNIKHPKRKKTRRLLSIVTAAALCITSVGIPFGAKEAKAERTTEKSASELSNPTTDSDGVTTWDCVYFGNYWQNDTNGDGKADQNDMKEPIKWRVLSVDGNDAFLLADQNLDSQPYHDENTSVTWETCTLRTWLNDTFLTNAFSSAEQAAIQSTTVVNDDNPIHGTEGGNDTTDQVYLLSIEEACDTTYGFDGTLNAETKRRETKNTEYAKDSGADTDFVWEGNGTWWLRSPGNNSSAATYVCCSGWGSDGGARINSSGFAVRPALHVNLSHLNLSSSTLWSYAGKVTSDGDSGTSQTTSPTPTKEPSAEPEKTGTPTQAPTKAPTVTPTSTHTPSISELSNPTTDSDGVTTWDCVYFGNYWQNDTNGDGKADQNDMKEPIKWRVLSVDGNDAFLLADQNLDSQPYHDENTSVTWETCSLRTWLNDTFLTNAFSSAEQAAIQSTTVVNNDNPIHGTEGGNDTTDQVYLLSIEEACDTTYGFHLLYYDFSGTREAKNTAYAKACGAETDTSAKYEGNGSWWLRSPGDGVDYGVSIIIYSGWGSNTNWVYVSGCTVRPVLHLDLSCSTLWSYAGKVSAYVGNSASRATSSPTSIPTEKPTEAPSETPSVTASTAPAPTEAPSEEPSKAPSATASTTPTPTEAPCEEPSEAPSVTASTTPAPTEAPSEEPSEAPSATASTTPTPTEAPSEEPSQAPSTTASTAPTPTEAPNEEPSQAPSVTASTAPAPTEAPSEEPSQAPSVTAKATLIPSVQLESLKVSGKGKAKAEWKQVAKIDGYRLQYAQDKKFKKKAKRKWLAAKKKSVTLTGLKKKKTYYVRICAYVLSDGKKVYGKWSNVKKVKIKK